MSIINSLKDSFANLFKKEPKKITFIIGEDFNEETKIPDLQDRTEYWDDQRVEDIASLDNFLNDPKPFYDFYNNKKSEFKKFTSTSLHKSLAKLKDDYDITIITLSVDSLFERVGFKKVIHIHGCINEYFCDYTLGGCSNIFKIKGKWDNRTECPRCSETYTIRPNLVWLRQDTEFSTWQDACLAVENCDLLVQISLDAQHPMSDALLSKCYSNKLEINAKSSDPEEMIFEFLIEKQPKEGSEEMKKKLKKYVSYKKPKQKNESEEESPKKKSKTKRK